MKPDNLEEKFKDQVHTKKQSKSTKKKNTSPLPLSLVEIANVINTIHHVKTAKEIQWDGAFGDIISAAYNKER